MSKDILIRGAFVVNEGTLVKEDVRIEGTRIAEIGCGLPQGTAEIIDAEGLLLLPGVIDTHVHFREPGYEHKGCIETESMAAASGGVTYFLDMPNNSPMTATISALCDKQQRAATDSVVNYGFYLAATADSAKLFAEAKVNGACAAKLFMGATTGVSGTNSNALDEIFAAAAAADLLLVAHCEDTAMIQDNPLRPQLEQACNSGTLPILQAHAAIRMREACIASTKQAIALAEKHGTRLHIAHITTREEVEMLRNAPSSVTAETCVGYLLWDKDSGASLGAKIKCNPAIKDREDREALLQAAKEGVLKTISTDHAPHLLSEKHGDYADIASGTPYVQFSLPAMLDTLAPTTVADRMCHAPADIFCLSERGYIRKGYFADLVLVEKREWTLDKKDVVSRCGWSPFEGHTFRYRIHTTIVNGQIVNRALL